MRTKTAIHIGVIVGWLCVGTLVLGIAYSRDNDQKGTSYSPVDITEGFATIMTRMKAAKPEVMKRQMDLLHERYDLANRPAKDVTMSRGKPIQEGVRARLPQGVTWEKLEAMSPEEIREKDVFPAGFFPLPHPITQKAACFSPSSTSTRFRSRRGEISPALTWISICPIHFLPEFPAPIYLTTRPDLGDVSQGKLVTMDNYYELFNGILNPKQLEGLRLLRHPVPAATVQPD